MAETRERKGKKPGIVRFLPIVILVAGLIGFFALGLDKYASIESLRDYHDTLKAYVDANAVLSAVGFVVAYIVVVAFSLPGGALMSVIAGFLFGVVTGSVLVVVGATIGATALFLAARTALGDLLRARAGGAIERMRRGFKDNAFSYLLFLRLVPVFPFWLVNLVPALVGVPLGTYVLATFLGIIPGSIVFVSVGNGLGEVFERDEEPDLGIVFSPEILLPLIGLGILALVPGIYKKLRARGVVKAHGEVDDD